MKGFSLRHIILCFALGVGGLLSAQTIDGEVGHFYERHTTKEREGLAVPFVRESDVVWEQTVWRTIDIREKFNHYFYYPVERKGVEGRKNFAYVIWDAVVSGEIPIYSDDEFKIPLDNAMFVNQFTKPDTIVLEIVDDEENYEYKTVLVPKEFNSEEMLQIRIKENLLPSGRCEVTLQLI